MKRMYVPCLVSLVLAFALAAEAGGVKMCQTVTLTNGWNAVYVRVAPEEPADKLFAAWPVDWVALYDPADYLTTKQFTDTTDTEGTLLPGYRVWRRGDRAVSSFAYVSANSVLVAFATNACSSVFCGTPSAPRTEWHDTSAEGTANLVGISTYGETTTSAYFAGLDVGSATFYRFMGTNKSKPTVVPISIGKAAALKRLCDGDVVLVDSQRTSDWSGPLNVSPASGIDFGTAYKMSQLEVLNDSGADRTVAFTLRACQETPGSTETPPLPPPLYWRDAYVAVTNSTWTNLYVGVTITNRVAAGDKWTVQLAVDRTKCIIGDGLAPSGTVFGAIAEFSDVTSSTNVDGRAVESSRMVSYVPISLTVGNTSADATSEMKHGAVWPAGLWVAVADLDTVTYIGAEQNYQGKKMQDVPSGGTMRVRLPIWADVDDQGEGEMWLLQRFTYGYTTNGALRVYSGAVTEADEPLVDLKRYSTPFLPTDQPTVKFASDAVFGTGGTATFTVGENSAVNPMRHATHPRHDGLLADYSGSTPSGDNLQNYVSTVKPEVFSITNRVIFTWDKSGSTGWNPSETLSGDLTWEFEGLRHGEANQAGTIRAKGRFAMKYVTLGPVRGISK